MGKYVCKPSRVEIRKCLNTMVSMGTDNAGRYFRRDIDVWKLYGNDTIIHFTMIEHTLRIFTLPFGVSVPSIPFDKIECLSMGMKNGLFDIYVFLNDGTVLCIG